MGAEDVEIIDGMQSLEDRFAPKFEAFFGQDAEDPSEISAAPIALEEAREQERSRINDRIFFSASGDPDEPPPRVGQLLPLAGPWGEERGQRTNDVLSMELKESIEDNRLATFRVRLHNVYDPRAQRYRYTDIPDDTPEERRGQFPLMDYGRTLALRMGYRDDVQVVFEGIVNKIDASFPADGQPGLDVTAVDKRDRLRAKKLEDPESYSGPSEEAVAANLAGQAGLHVAIRPDQETPLSGPLAQPTDQDILSFLSHRANQAALELSCFGNTVFLLTPGDDASSALRYAYRRGLISFEPSFNASGLPTSVRVVCRDPVTQRRVEATSTPQRLQEQGLAPDPGFGPTALDAVRDMGGAGDREEVVTNYYASSENECQRIADGIMKRNLDKVFTATGEVLGDPRIRVRTTLRIDGVGRYSGFYYVTEVTHRFGANGYQTSFRARRNSALREQEGTS